MAAESALKLAPLLNGKWKLDKKESSSVAPLLKALGAPWVAQKMADSALPEWTLTLTSEGLDHKVVGLLGMSTDTHYVFGATTTMKDAMGALHPARLTFDSQGRLATLIDMEGENRVVTTTFEVDEGSGLLIAHMTLTKGPANEVVVNIKRVFARQQ